MWCVTECVTYPGLRRLADFLRIRLHGVQMDHDGVDVDAFEAACINLRPKAFYCVVNMHNPTGIVVSVERRRARWPRSPASTASRSSKTTSMDSCSARATSSPCRRMHRSLAIISPASRNPWRRACAWATSPFRKAPSTVLHKWCARPPGWPPPLTAEIAADWVEDGTGMDLAEAHRIEAIARQRMARRILSEVDICGDESSYHIWLHLPEPWTADGFALQARLEGRRRVAGHHFLADTQCAQWGTVVPLCTGRPAHPGKRAAAYRRYPADAARRLLRNRVI